MTLRVGIGAVPLQPDAVEFVCQAERLGVDSVWVPEFWAGDAFTPLAYLAARTSTIKLGSGIAQLGARTPAKDAARRRVPTAIGLGTNLVGTDDLVRERLRLYRDAGITTLRANLQGGPDAGPGHQLGDLERLLDLVRQVNDETGEAAPSTER